jgi:DNA-binding transcriptional LysR family regulator
MSNQSVPNVEHEPEAKSPRVLNWEDIRIFVGVARLLSFRAAERELKISLNTIRRHIQSLEDETGTPLFTRHVNGLALTREGQRMFIAAQQMEEASFGVKRMAQSNLNQLSGEVRLSVTEDLGTFWVIPRLVEFQRTYPRLIVDISCTMQKADILRMESDVSIQLERPENPDLIFTKLGRMHIMPFASSKYIDIYGRPQTVPDGIHHKFVLQVSDQADFAMFKQIYPGAPEEGLIAVKTNTSSAHYWAVAQGAGIGMIPTYGWALGGRVVPIDFGLRVSKDIFLAYHPDARRIKRISLMIDEIKKMFDSRKYPWFRDEFLLPDDLLAMVDPNDREFEFEGFKGL